MATSNSAFRIVNGFNKDRAKQSRVILESALLLSLLCFGAATTVADEPAGVDGTFDAGGGATGGNILAVSYISDQGAVDASIFIGGTFTTYDGTSRARIARLTGDGVLFEPQEYDPATPIGTFSPRVSALAMDHNGRVVIGGWFAQVGDESRNSIARLNVDGSVDEGFSSFEEINGGTTGIVHDLAIRQDGSIVVVGGFTSFNEAAASRIAVIDDEGALVEDFEFEGGFNNDALRVVLDGQERILVGGDFTEFDNEPAARLVRLGSSGEMDLTFDIGEGFNGTVHEIFIAGDYIFVGGDFDEFDGDPAPGLVKLDSNGGRVSAGDFDIGTGFNGSVRAINVQDNGKILVGGNFTEVDRDEDDNDNGEQDEEEYSFIRLVRLQSDGSIDTTFQPGSGADGMVRSITLLDDGRILVAGDFFNYNGQSHGSIVRLNGGEIDDEPPDETGYDLWVSEEFPGETNPGIIGPEADPDHDGVANLLEYAFNGDPNVPGSVELPVLETVTEEGGEHLQITFIRIDAEDLVYSVEASDALDVWEEIWNSQTDAEGSETTLEELVDWDHDIGQSETRSRFLRVVVTLID